MKVTLPPRLTCILNHIDKPRIADIGTDHAYIPIRAIQDGICEYAIASDIRPGPCMTAKQNIQKYHLEHQITVRQGSGITTIQAGETDMIIIAGMGGEVIRNILSEGESCAKSQPIILQPMNFQYELRKYLLENGYKIIQEDLAIEQYKVYNILMIEAGTQSPFSQEIDYHLPPSLYYHPHFKHLQKKKEREF